jgi:hypothetical protein
MMSETATTRHALPNIYVGQAQKEVTHNEALAKIDSLLHPVVEDYISTPPPALDSNSDGLCWLIAAAATGVWTGKAGQIARWSGGGWRYMLPVEGLVVWHAVADKRLFYVGGNWIEPAAVGDPVGGSVIDVEARAAISAILGRLRQLSYLPN